jgi:glutamate-ammonia-ligase adenylyltransferase
MCGELGLIPADLAEQCSDSYRLFRRLQHRQRLNGQPSRAAVSEVSEARKPVQALWQTIFEDESRRSNAHVE